MNKDSKSFQYNSGDLVYLISPLIPQLRTSSRKFGVNYVGPLIIYKIVDLHNYLLMTIEGQLMRGLFEHERLKPATIPMDRGNVRTSIGTEKSHELGNNSLICLPQNHIKRAITLHLKRKLLLTSPVIRDQAESTVLIYHHTAFEIYYSTIELSMVD